MKTNPHWVPIVTRSQEARNACLATETVTRYVITHIGSDGLRTLASAAQGRHTFATREEAETWLERCLSVNSESTLRSLYGLPLEVRACQCYPGHCDPCGLYFDQ